MKKNTKIIKKTKNFRKTRKTRKPRKKIKSSKSYKIYRGGMDAPPPAKLMRVEDVDYSFNVVLRNSNGIERYEKITGKYSGPWKYGKPYQKGTFVIYNRNNQFITTYEGNWIDGVPNGKGITTFANGDRYEGDYEAGIQNGKGIKTFSNGNRYEGDFKNGTLNGNGILDLNDGSKYTGQFKDGTINGNGIFHNSNGSKYEGEFLNNKKNGYGVLTSENGEVYAGQWKDNLRYGIGTFTTATRKYTGVWHEGEPSGDGQMIFFKTDVTIKGVFRYIRSSDGTVTLKIEGTAFYPDGSTYTGTFIDYEKIEGHANPSSGLLASNDSYNIRFGFENYYEPMSVTDAPFL